MKKTIKFNNSAVFNLQTLNGMIMTTWIAHCDESEEQIEKAFMRALSDFNGTKNNYDVAFNLENGPYEYEIGYEKNLLSKLNKDIKKVKSYKLPWFIKTYTDFIEEKFNGLMIIYKNGGWK